MYVQEVISHETPVNTKLRNKENFKFYKELQFTE